MTADTFIASSRLQIDPNEIRIITLRATGGEVGSSSALAPKIGPLGLVSVGHEHVEREGQCADWGG